jgi:hypothetical protein
MDQLVITIEINMLNSKALVRASDFGKIKEHRFSTESAIPLHVLEVAPP